MRFPFGIEALGFPLDAKRGELVPWLIDGHAPEFPHRLGTGNGPVHPGTFPAVLDHVTAGAFDDAGGDRVAGGQVFVIAHSMWMGLEIATDALDPLAFGARQGALLGPVAKPDHEGFDPAVKES